MKKTFKLCSVIMILIVSMFILQINNVNAASTVKVYFKVGDQTYTKEVDKSLEKLIMPTETELKENGISLTGKKLLHWQHQNGTGRTYNPGSGRGGGVSEGLTMVATLEDINYSIVTKANCDETGAKVEVTSNGKKVTNAKYGDNLKISLTLPDEGYEVTALTVAGKSILDGADKTEYNITAPEGNTSNQIIVEATFAKKTYNVTVNSTVENGTISSDKSTLEYNESCTITVTPNEGYEVDYLKLNNEPVTVTDNTYTASNVKKDLDFEVAFKKKVFEINLDTKDVEHGSILIKPTTVEYNGSCTITVTPDEGYELDYLKVDGSPVEVTENTYSISNVKANHSVEVAFKIKTFTVTTEVTSGKGSIQAAPSTVEYGSQCIVMIVPEIGYKLDYLDVNGKKIYNLESIAYTLSDIKENYVIKAAFTKLPFTLTIDSVDGATVDPTGSVTVLYDESQEVSIKANEGYKLISVKVDGVEQTLPLANDKLIIENITKDTKVEIVVEKIKFQVKTSVVGENGAITEGKTVEYGDDFLVKLVPAKGYMIDKLLVNGEEVKAEEDIYELKNIKQDYTVEVSYTKIPFELKIESADNAIINPMGTLVVYYGDNQTINIKASRGYKLVKVTVNGVEQELPLTDDKLELTGITEDTVVVATIEKETYVVVEGKDQTYSNEGELRVRFSGDLDLFVKLLINGVELDESYYTKESGSTIIKLSDAYLASLPDGTYEMEAVYSNGNSAKTTFTIARSEEEEINNPTTGDTILLSIAIFSVSVAGAVLTIRKFKKSK